MPRKTPQQQPTITIHRDVTVVLPPAIVKRAVLAWAVAHGHLPSGADAGVRFCCSDAGATGLGDDLSLDEVVITYREEAPTDAK